MNDGAACQQEPEASLVFHSDLHRLIVRSVSPFTVALEVQGQELAHGVSGAAFNVPALGEAEFDMNVTASMATALVKLLGMRGKSAPEALDYRLVGKVSLSEGMFRSIPFEEKGTFKLR